MKYLKQIQELESFVYKNMGKCSQITIDLVQNTEQQLNRDESEQRKDPIRRDELGAINYQIGILLEVFIDSYSDYSLSQLEKRVGIETICNRFDRDIELIRGFIKSKVTHRNHYRHFNKYIEVISDLEKREFYPILELDIEVIKRLDEIIENWKNDIEFVNKALDIPLHDG